MSQWVTSKRKHNTPWHKQENLLGHVTEKFQGKVAFRNGWIQGFKDPRSHSRFISVLFALAGSPQKMAEALSGALRVLISSAYSTQTKLLYSSHFSKSCRAGSHWFISGQRALREPITMIKGMHFADWPSLELGMWSPSFSLAEIGREMVPKGKWRCKSRLRRKR